MSDERPKPQLVKGGNRVETTTRAEEEGGSAQFELYSTVPTIFTVTRVMDRSVLIGRSGVEHKTVYLFPVNRDYLWEVSGILVAACSENAEGKLVLGTRDRRLLGYDIEGFPRWEMDIDKELIGVSMGWNSDTFAVGMREVLFICPSGDPNEMVKIEIPKKKISQILVSDNGARIFQLIGRALTCRNKDGDELWTHTLSGMVTEIATTEEGNKVAALVDNRTLVMLNKDGEPSFENKLAGRPNQLGGLGLTTDGSKVLASHEFGVDLFDASGGTIHSAAFEDSQVASASLSRDGSVAVYASSRPKKITAMETEGWTPSWFYENAKMPYSLVASRDGTQVLAACRLGTTGTENGIIRITHSNGSD